MSMEMRSIMPGGCYLPVDRVRPPFTEEQAPAVTTKKQNEGVFFTSKTATKVALSILGAAALTGLICIARSGLDYSRSENVFQDAISSFVIDLFDSSCMKACSHDLKRAAEFSLYNETHNVYSPSYMSPVLTEVLKGRVAAMLETCVVACFQA
ncbi:MAG: hypothetical protein WCF65_03670 [Parachlamydiaceae bacterium]